MTTNATGTGEQPTVKEMDVVSAFGELLSVTDEEDGKQGDEATAETDESTEQETAGEEDVEAPADDEATEEEAEESDESEEEEETEEGQQEQLYTVRVDGKEEQVPLAELLAGYSRQSDYTRKTQALSEERKSLVTEQAAARKERSEYATLLPKLREAIESGMGKEPNWEELRAQDPTKASIEWQRWQEKKQRIEAVRAEEARVAQQEQDELAAERNRVLVEQRDKLLEKLPAWRDKKVAATESELISKALRDAGFGEDELQIYDHRAILIALKAAKYDALQAKKPELKQKMQKAPVVKPGGGKPKVRTEVDAVRDRFKKSGSVSDLTKLFEHAL